MKRVLLGIVFECSDLSLFSNLQHWYCPSTCEVVYRFNFFLILYVFLIINKKKKFDLLYPIFSKTRVIFFINLKINLNFGNLLFLTFVDAYWSLLLGYSNITKGKSQRFLLNKINWWNYIFMVPPK